MCNQNELPDKFAGCLLVIDTWLKTSPSKKQREEVRKSCYEDELTHFIQLLDIFEEFEIKIRTLKKEIEKQRTKYLHDKFTRHLDQATETIKKWPLWKQYIFGLPKRKN